MRRAGVSGVDGRSLKRIPIQERKMIRPYDLLLKLVDCLEDKPVSRVRSEIDEWAEGVRALAEVLYYVADRSTIPEKKDAFLMVQHANGLERHRSLVEAVEVLEMACNVDGPEDLIFRGLGECDQIFKKNRKGPLMSKESVEGLEVLASRVYEKAEVIKGSVISFDCNPLLFEVMRVTIEEKIGLARQRGLKGVVRVFTEALEIIPKREGDVQKASLVYGLGVGS